jgi:oxaloacetate decarboxylase gamma subunit
MPITNLLMTGVELMLLGMGIVFSFLILLVLTLKVMSQLVGRFHSPEVPPKVSAAQPNVADTRLIAVLTAAVARYRADHKA